MRDAIYDRYRYPRQIEETIQVDTHCDKYGLARFEDYLGLRENDVLGSSSLCYLHPDLVDAIGTEWLKTQFPLDPTNLVEALGRERYMARTALGVAANPVLGKLYYSARPFLPLALRQRLQKFYFRGWEKFRFPAWPIDVTAEGLIETALKLRMKLSGIKALPFIWFWPRGAPAAAMLTHDVETVSGLSFCRQLMDIDESYGFRSAFQIVPEGRYEASTAFLDHIWARGHEVNVQDFNHDGNLFRDKQVFLTRAEAINKYARLWGAKGFRSAILYRNLDWYVALDFAYDMSVPNTGRLEAQRGGCCTVFPYFIGDILELPLTTTQDYSLFNTLRQYNIDLWKAQT